MSEIAKRIQPRPKFPNLMTMDEVAEVLRLSDSGVRRCIYDLGLPAVRLGSKMLVRADDLLLFIDAATTSYIKSADNTTEVVKIAAAASA
jgi:excisionase family DNA binding protein